jgi:hypothetical protein
VLPDADGRITRHVRGKNGYATGAFELVQCDQTVSGQSLNSELTVRPPFANALIPDSLNPDSLIPDTSTPRPSAAGVASSDDSGQDDGQSGPADAITERAIELAVLLRKRGAAVTGSNPDVRKMAEQGVSDGEALAALEKAQQQRSDKADTSPINAGYLLSIMAGARASATGRAMPKPLPKNYSNGVRNGRLM